MDPTEDIDDLWEGLNLGGLLNDLARENESALAQAKKLQARRVRRDCYTFFCIIVSCCIYFYCSGSIQET
jgi:hypothetical protein